MLGEEMDTTGDISAEDADKKMIPDQVLLSDLRRGGQSVQVSRGGGGEAGVSILLQDTNTNICHHNNSFIWCLPNDYNQEKHPFTCRHQSAVSPSNLSFRFSSRQQISALGLRIQICH